ncbi:MAG TPA: hypothetical protein ENK18_01030 [Deltaproteobacteria bacterium]|nr:hypothetical protein [Deltaproteobacteria bacterium]
MFWWLLGCELIDPPVEEIVIDDIQILGLVMDPPESGPGEIVQLTPWVIAPEGRGYDLLVWTCTPLNGDGPRCLEALLGIEPWAISVAPGEDLFAPGQLWVPPEAAELLTLVETLQLPLYSLACEPQRCPIIERVIRAPPWPSSTWSELYAELADPQAMMSRIGFQGAHLAIRSFVLSRGLDADTRNTNPTITPTSFIPSGSLVTSQTLELSFRIGDRQGGAMVAYGFASEGAITPSERVRFNEVTLYYTAPEVPTSSAQIWVVIEEDAGSGSAVYTQSWPVL